MQNRMPNSSPVTAKMKSVWASGRTRFIRSLARPFAEPAAGDEAFDGRVDLERIRGARAVAGVEEVQDAVAYMRHELIGQEDACRADAADPGHPEPMQPGHEEQSRPDERDQHGLPEVGLQDQRHDGDRQEEQRQQVAREHRAAGRPRRRPRRPG